eukprot:TRINITY_DN65257_c0_g1_i1.p1 TRINITY_DN65257_c0_g1~~TRINITY_DN65257_c0_g1_i1.p1  ORF type:complete len:523 (+),score=110.51 TRINITY_DN65257_c0_g1_i1:119-1687(+)
MTSRMTRAMTQQPTSSDYGDRQKMYSREAKSLHFHDRIKVRMQISKPSALSSSFDANAARRESLDRTFGGIDRRVRTRQPTMKQFKAFTRFANSFVGDEHTRDPYIVAFVNSKSGGQAGELIMKTLKESLSKGKIEGKFQGEVCDLSAKGEPDGTIASLAQKVQQGLNVRLLVCGGDGTVTWILTALEGCKALDGLQDKLAVGIAPLGTGNDLARSLGWGARMRSVADILQYLQWMAEAEPVLMDQWRLVLRPHKQVPKDHKLRTCGSHPQLVQDGTLSRQLLAEMEEALEKTMDEQQEVFLGFWQNYFSIGTDAKIAKYVDTSRNTTTCGRQMFRLGLGKVCYAYQLLFTSYEHFVTPFIENLKAAEYNGPVEYSSGGDLQDLEPPLLERKACGGTGMLQQLMMVNINSYGAGMRCQPTESQVQYRPAPADGTFEVLGLRNMACFAAMYLGAKGPTHMFSTSKTAFSVSAGEYMQQDGEPWKLDEGCDVMVEPHRKVTMLRAPSSAIWGGHIKPCFWDSEE